MVKAIILPANNKMISFQTQNKKQECNSYYLHSKSFKNICLIYSEKKRKVKEKGVKKGWSDASPRIKVLGKKRTSPLYPDEKAIHHIPQKKIHM